MNFCFDKNDITMYSMPYNRIVLCYYRRVNGDFKKVMDKFGISKSDLKYILKLDIMDDLRERDFIILDLVLKENTYSYKKMVKAMYRRYKDEVYLCYILGINREVLRSILNEKIDIEYSEYIELNMIIDKFREI